MLGRTLILCGGPLDRDFAKRYVKRQHFDSVICADSGLDATRDMGIAADFLIGDFDSVSKASLREYMDSRREGAEYIRYPSQKDYTDAHLAMEWALERSPTEIALLGAAGGRLDHFLANLNILALPLKKGIFAYIADEKNKIYMIREGFTMRKDMLWGKYISLIPFTQKVENVVLKGFKYPLSGETLYAGESRGISNEPAAGCEELEISFDGGILIVVEARD